MWNVSVILSLGQELWSIRKNQIHASGGPRHHPGKRSAFVWNLLQFGMQSHLNNTGRPNSIVVPKRDVAFLSWFFCEFGGVVPGVPLYPTSFELAPAQVFPYAKYEINLLQFPLVPAILETFPFFLPEFPLPPSLFPTRFRAVGSAFLRDACTCTVRVFWCPVLLVIYPAFQRRSYKLGLCSQ